MGDSDDEYDHKRRDKFRGERAEASYRGAERPVRPREDWHEREWSRPRPRDYPGRIRDRGYSPSFESTAKRLRNDYYSDNFYSPHYPSYHQPQHREPPPTNVEGQQPPMMSFKAFLVNQDDNITDNEAIKKYNEYKLEFQRQQLNEFFLAHREDEWFRFKYHPEDSVRRKEEQMKALKKRVEVFLDMMNSGKLSDVSIDSANNDELIKLLDTVVIKLEGGSDEDISLLEQEYAELEKNKVDQHHQTKDDVSVNNAASQEEEGEVEEKQSEEKQEDEVPETKANGDEDKEEEVMEEPKEPTEEKQKLESESEEKLEEEEQDAEKMDIEGTTNEESKGEEITSDVEKTENETAEPTKPEKEKKRKRSFSGSSSSSSSSSSDSEEEKMKPEKEPEEKPEPEKEIVEKTEEKHDKPKSLHKTTSIFLRNLAPTITRQEVEAMCARYDGFLRVALADPQPERRWLRRGWVTFKRDANIKEICWNLNNIRLRDCELGAIVNRDLSRRIRQVNGITSHKQVVRSDIRICAKVVLHLDSKSGLWPDEEDKEKPTQTFGLVSNNPVLHNITDYLIEEASAEEEELLGLEPSADAQDPSATVERDENLITVLDRIVYYLRIVHSVDYYNHCEYPNEDEMPNRCGILHARGPLPTAKTDISQFIGPPVELKMANFLPEKPPKDDVVKNDAKLVELSLKDVYTEIDNFVQANTRELSKDKWLCPLSGKKFKGPDFVRKHIFNKHAEKIEEVKKDVEFFNNYLKDTKRPMLAEAPQPKREEASAYPHPSSYSSSYGGYGYGMPSRYNSYTQRPRGGGGGGFHPRSRGNSGTDYRTLVQYRDLDAPREPEEFI